MPDLRQRKDLAGQQQRMLKQMRAQQRQEAQATRLLRQQHGEALQNILWSHVKTLGLLLFIGMALLFYFNPLFLRKRPKLPSRRLVSVYPSGVELSRDLPRFYDQYSIVTPTNAPARQRVQHMQQLRKWASQTKLKQSIQLMELEHDRFIANDGICGQGFADLYHASPESLQVSLLHWCLLFSGRVDGYVGFSTELQGGMVRGIQGTAVVVDDDWVDPTSIMVLPIRNSTQLALPNEPPSTVLPPRAMEWLAQHAAAHQVDPKNLAQDFGRYLYSAIQAEENWVLLRMDCANATEFRPIGTTCLANGTCCTMVDPNLAAFVRRHDDDDDE